MLGQLLQHLIIFIRNQAAYFALCFERIDGTRVVRVGSGTLAVTAQLRNIACSGQVLSTKFVCFFSINLHKRCKQHKLNVLIHVAFV
jgi:hypothetical protein